MTRPDESWSTACKEASRCGRRSRDDRFVKPRILLTPCVISRSATSFPSGSTRPRINTRASRKTPGASASPTRTGRGCLKPVVPPGGALRALCDHSSRLSFAPPGCTSLSRSGASQRGRGCCWPIRPTRPLWPVTSPSTRNWVWRWRPCWPRSDPQVERALPAALTYLTVF